ncbi:MAG: Bacterial rane protein YfhO [Deltaproteobacteria bacterium]|nr:Bacterial rane protein YfhO [Deltaproteobacteria bacterium]
MKVEARVIIFGGLLAIVSLILAFGHNTPIYKIVYLLPGFDRFRAPSKIMVLWAFSMALLAGIGMDGPLSHMKKGFKRRLYPLLLLVFSLVVLVIVFHFAPSAVLKAFSPLVLADAIPERLADAARIISIETQRLTLVLALILLLFLLLRRNFLSHRITTALLCALLLMDLAYVHREAVRHDDSLYEKIAKIKKDLQVSFSRDNSLYRVGAFKHPLGANLEMVLGYQTVGGFTALFPSRYYNYIDKYADYQLPRGWVSFFYGVSRVPVLMDLLNVKYEISYADKSIGLRNTFLPRAFIIPECTVARRQDILNLLTSSDFDPRKTVLFEKEDNTPSPGALTRKPSLSDSDTVEIKTFRPDTIVLNTSSQNPGYLYLSEIHYPGWNAYIDDQRANILRGNYLFRVIPIPEGRHHIRLHFDPLTIKVGIGISVIAALVILGSLIYFSRRNRIQTPL